MKRFLFLAILVSLTVVHIAASAQTITVNGQSSGASVASAGNITVAVSGGGGAGYDATAWMGVCTASGPYSSANCDFPYPGVSVNNCGIWAGGSTIIAAKTCTFTAPVMAGNYVAAFFRSYGNYTPLATAPFTVTGGFTGGGTGCSDADSGVGASLGLVCQASLSDDFNGTAIDTTKWDIRWSPTEGNGYAVVPSNITSTGGTWGEFFTKNLLPAGRPVYIESRIRFQGTITGLNYAVWVWGCDYFVNNAACYATSTNNLPEIDLHETVYSDGQHQCLNTHLWSGGSFTSSPFGECGAVGHNIQDGNWHTLGLRLDPNPAPNGTLYFYQDGSLLTSWPATTPYFVHPEQSSLGLGYQYILSMGCTASCQSLLGATEQDVDYVHVYQQASGSCSANNNSSFQISGNTLSTINPLSAGTYTANVVVTMAGVSNSGTCFPVTVTGTSGGGGPSITVNGSSGATVSAGASMTVAVANGPGNNNDWMGICTTATPSNPTCDGAGYQWAWMSCTHTLPPTPLTSASCILTAPSTAGNYQAVFFWCNYPSNCPNGGYNVLATAAFTVTGGGGGGGVQPFGSIPCPRGCTWNNVFNADFTAPTAGAGMFDNTAAVTNAMYWVPTDGGYNHDSSDNTSTFACYSGGMLDTSHLPGYLALHAYGTIGWETSGGYSCTLAPKVSTKGTPPGCPHDQYSKPTCIPLTTPVLWELRSQEAPNQIDQFTIAAYAGAQWGFNGTPTEPIECYHLQYYGESRGNNVVNTNAPWDWHAGCTGFAARDFPNNRSDDAQHVSTLVFDPQAGWRAYWDGVLQTSPTYSTGVINLFGCAPGVPCVDAYGGLLTMDVAVTGPTTNGVAGGTWAITWQRMYLGQ